MRSFSQLLLSLIILMFPINVNAASEQDYLDFFKKYQALNDAYDPTVAEMYSDDALVMSTTIDAQGTESTVKYKGHTIKKIINDIMQLGKSAGAKSDFSNVAISMEETSAKITATRYSHFSCYTDKNFYLVVKKQESGELQIIKEYAEETMESKCKSGDKNRMETMLKASVMMINKSAPIKVDPEVELTMASTEGNQLFYHYNLIHVPSSEIPGEKLKELTRPSLVDLVCKNPTVTSLKDAGVIFTFIYYGNDNIEITRVTTQKSDCESPGH